MANAEVPAWRAYARRCLQPAASGPWLDRLHVFRSCGLLATPLAIGNLLAVWWGWTVFYRAQFLRTPGPLWPLVSDSPNAVLALALVLLAARLGWRWGGLDLLAWVLNVKVGLWTAFVLLYWYEPFFASDPALQWFLFWLHLGMVAQAFVVHRSLRGAPLGWSSALVVSAVVVLDYALDYWPGVSNHPWLPGGPYVFADVAGLLTGLIVLVSLGWAWWSYGPQRAVAVSPTRPVS